MFIVPITPMATQLNSISGVSKDAESQTISESVSDTAQTFADYLKQSIAEVKALEAASDQSAYDLAVGNRNDLETVMIESAKASTAVETTVQIVTRAVNAYKSVIEMQI